MRSAPTTEPLDDRLRLELYRRLGDDGDMPSIASLGTALGVSTAAAHESLERLAQRHVLQLAPSSREVWKAGPFAAGPTPYRVLAPGRQWWAHCAWDALAVPATLATQARVETRCEDCGEALALEVDPEHGPDGEGVVFFALPAARWYDDIVFT